MMYLVFFMGFVAVWVAGQINAEVQAALGMVNQCGILLMVVAMAISSGATAAVSQSLGALKVARAQRYVATTVLGCFVLGFVVALPPAEAVQALEPSIVLDRVQDAGNVGSILRTAAERLGAARCEILAAGDGANDLAMLALAGTRLAWRPKPRILPHVNVVSMAQGLDAVLELLP